MQPPNAPDRQAEGCVERGDAPYKLLTREVSKGYENRMPVAESQPVFVTPTSHVLATQGSQQG